MVHLQKSVSDCLLFLHIVSDMSHLKCSSVGILLVLVLLSYSSFAFGEVGYSKEEMTLNEKGSDVSLCWKSAYESLVIGCSEILVGEEERLSLAWNLTDCVRKDIGDQTFPYCDVKSPIKDCIKKLDDDAHMMYLELYRKTNDICLLLQTGAAFKRQMERLVKELKRGTMQQEQMIVQADSKQQELIELEEQLNKVQEKLERLNKAQVGEKLELIQESVPFDAEKLYTLHKAHMQKLRVIAAFVICLLIYTFCY